MANDQVNKLARQVYDELAKIRDVGNEDAGSLEQLVEIQGRQLKMVAELREKMFALGYANNSKCE